MNNVKIGNFSVSEFDSLLQLHPAFTNLDENRRLTIYNNALDYLSKLYIDRPEELLTGLTISSDAQVTYPESPERELIYDLQFDDKDDERESNYNTWQLGGFLQKDLFFQSLTRSEIFFIVNLAQQSVANLYNKINSDEYIFASFTWNRYAEKRKSLNVYSDIYCDLKLFASSTTSVNTTIDIYPNLTIGGRKDTTKQVYSDIYVNLSIKDSTIPNINTYLDLYPNLNITGQTSTTPGDKDANFTTYLDIYTNLAVTTGPAAQGVTKETTTYIYPDIYVNLRASTVSEVPTTIYMDIYPVLTVTGP